MKTYRRAKNKLKSVIRASNRGCGLGGSHGRVAQRSEGLIGVGELAIGAGALAVVDRDGRLLVRVGHGAGSAFGQQRGRIGSVRFEAREGP